MRHEHVPADRAAHEPTSAAASAARPARKHPMNRSAFLFLPAGWMARAVRGAVGLALAVAGIGAGMADAASAALPSNCAQSGITVTCTFTAQGESQFTVPFGVSSITATTVGAQGRPDNVTATPGGLGAQATGSFTVGGGQTVYVEVGVLGGAGGVSTGGVSGGAGGGESDVRTCPAAGTCSSGTTLGSRLLVAGGGGGGGTFSGAGGNAGTTGAAGNGGLASDGLCKAGVGTGATRLTFGTGGAGCDSGSDGTNGTNGAEGTGGAGGDTNVHNGVPGGGGGAGWFGGGGGGGAAYDNDAGGGGGGGSSNAAASVTGTTFTQAAAGQAPSVTLTFIDMCSQSGPVVTCTFTAPGESQFRVPSGVSSVTATAVGAQGGADYGSGTPGGLGAQAAASITVTAGQKLYVEVDVLGGAPGLNAGYGGGESDVRTCPAAGTCSSGTTLGSRLLVAGGGGGTGNLGVGPGGNAGTSGAAQNGPNGSGGVGCNAGGGTGAIRSAPGTGGPGGSYEFNGTDGAEGTGGAGGDWANQGDGGGGGGGGGWFGGGGGGSCYYTNGSPGGGGGGSSNAAASVTGATFTQAAAGQAPSVTLTYTAPVTSTLAAPDNRFKVTKVRARPDGSVTFTVTFPLAGIADVLETAWRDNFAHVATVLQPARGRFVFARHHLVVSRAGAIRVIVRPNRRGIKLVAHHSYGVVLRLWVSFTPTGGRQRNIGLYGLHVPHPKPRRHHG